MALVTLVKYDHALVRYLELNNIFLSLILDTIFAATFGDEVSNICFGVNT